MLRHSSSTKTICLSTRQGKARQGKARRSKAKAELKHNTAQRNQAKPSQAKQIKAKPIQQQHNLRVVCLLIVYRCTNYHQLISVIPQPAAVSPATSSYQWQCYGGTHNNNQTHIWFTYTGGCRITRVIIYHTGDKICHTRLGRLFGADFLQSMP